jgi:DMSO/TMAO reductase YedYZ molybdopterin-dependent catalytic subunit
VEGWSVYDVPWNGVRLSEIVDRVKPLPAAAYVNFRTVTDKYNESLPLAVAKEPKTVVAYGVGGATLPLEHGFPLRLVVPRLLGYKNAKYVYRIEFDKTPLRGFWIEAGYPYAGEVPRRRLREGKY